MPSEMDGEVDTELLEEEDEEEELAGPADELLEEVLDYALYAPLGVALTVVEELPALVEKGRSRFTTQLGVARFVGRMALRQARRRIDDLFAPGEGAMSANRSEVKNPVRSSPTAAEASSRRDEVVVELAIPSYDSLAASQVVPRLAVMDAHDLAEVRAHEERHRARRTILARIDQIEQERRDG